LTRSPIFKVIVSSTLVNDKMLSFFLLSLLMSPVLDYLQGVKLKSGTLISRSSGQNVGLVSGNSQQILLICQACPMPSCPFAFVHSIPLVWDASSSMSA
jgi:hypothetical protein